MITLEDTEAAIKRCEQHLQRASTDDTSPKAKVLAMMMMLFIGTRFSTSTPQCIRQPRPRVYLKEGTYHTRLFRGPSTNDMKK
jgi:hypothetical protein